MFIYRPLMDWWRTSDPAKKARDPYWIIFNLEETREQVEARLLSMFIYETFGEQIRYKEMFSRGRDCMLTDEHYDMINRPECAEFLQLLDERIIYHDGTFNAAKYEKVLKEELQKFGKFSDGNYIPNNPDQLIGVIVDHLSLTRATSGRSKKEEMDLVSSQSVQFRNKCGIVSPIFVMQCNRDSSNAERLKQGLQEISESDYSIRKNLVTKLREPGNVWNDNPNPSNIVIY